MNRPELRVKFYKSSANREPVREWLKALDETDRKTIGDEIRLVQFGWPVGMPLVRKMQPDFCGRFGLLWQAASPECCLRCMRDTLCCCMGLLRKAQKHQKLNYKQQKTD